MVQNILRDDDSESALDSLGCIRKALLIGLASFGEIERLSNCCEVMKYSGTAVLDVMVPIHPTGADDTIGDFAEALRAIDHFEREVRNG